MAKPKKGDKITSSSGKVCKVIEVYKEGGEGESSGLICEIRYPDRETIDGVMEGSVRHTRMTVDYYERLKADWGKR